MISKCNECGHLYKGYQEFGQCAAVVGDGRDWRCPCLNSYHRAGEPIPMAACEKRAVYRILSRNLWIGVYDGKEGFVGIREKFGSKYLFTEYHRDQGAPFGTVTPIEKIGVLPDNVVDVLDMVEVVKRECSCAHPSQKHDRRCKHEDGDCYIGCSMCECACFDGERYVQSYPPLMEFLERFEPGQGEK